MFDSEVWQVFCNELAPDTHQGGIGSGISL